MREHFVFVVHGFSLMKYFMTIDLVSSVTGMPRAIVFKQPQTNVDIPSNWIDAGSCDCVMRIRLYGYVEKCLGTMAFLTGSVNFKLTNKKKKYDLISKCMECHFFQ